MTAGNIRAGRAYVEIGVRNNLKAGLQRATRQLKAFAVGAARMAAVAGAAIAGFAAVAIKSFADFGDSLNKMSARTGVSVEALSELKYAAEQSGSSLQTVEKGIKRLSATIYDAANGSKMAADALADLGLSAQELQGMSPEEQFNEVMKALAGVENASKRAALAQKVLGRAGTELLPLLNNMESLRDMAKQLGLTMSEEGAQAAADISDAINTVQSAWKGLFRTVLAQNAEFLTTMAKMTEAFARNLQRIMGAIGRNIITSTLEGFKGVADFFGAGNLGLDFAVAGTGLANQKANTKDLAVALKELLKAAEGGGGLGGGATVGRGPAGRFAGTTVPGSGYDATTQAVVDMLSKAGKEAAQTSLSAMGGFTIGTGTYAGMGGKIQEEQLSELQQIRQGINQIQIVTGGGPAFGS